LQSPIEVFCSYAHEDEALLNQLHTHLATLKRQNLITIWHDRQILPGGNWSRDIDAHLEQSRLILLLVSLDFLASDYCYEKEMKRALARHEAKEAHVVPIIVRPCDWETTDFAALQCLPQDGKPITLWENRDLAWKDVIASLRRLLADLQLLSASNPAPSSDMPAFWNIPYPPNPFFLGRDELMLQLHDQLQSGPPAALTQPQAISGLGGIGKTQLATEYAYRYRHEYKAVLWVRAEAQETLITSYSVLATLLNLPERDAQEQEITIQAVKTWLQTHHDWLLILDNADDLDLLPPFIPVPPGGHILITTRAHDMQSLARRIEVETLPPQQGALFLLRRATLLLPNALFEQAKPEEQTLALQLTQELGGLPLALDQAGAYLEATGTSLQAYQQLYQQRGLELLKQRRSRLPDHPEPVATTWSLSFQRVEERNPAAADLLRLCAFLAPDAIPEEIITQGLERQTLPRPPLLQRWFGWFSKKKETSSIGSALSSLADPQMLNQAIEALRAYSLLDRDPLVRQLSVHRLVQAVLKDQINESSRAYWAEHAVRAIAVTFPSEEHEEWPQCERLLPHALIAADLVEHYQFVFSAAAPLFNKMGLYLYKRGRYEEAEPLWKWALRIDEEQLGMEHISAAVNLNNLAILYYTQGRYEETESLLKRALGIYEEQLGGKHPETANNLNSLAALYYTQGRYEEAEPLYARALGIYEKQLGAKHPDTALILNNLAELYRVQGKYEEAELLYARTLGIYEKQLGAKHPDTARSLNNLAMLYYVQGKYEEAKALLERALAIWRRQLGQNHPNTLTARRSYAFLLRAMGRDEEAAALEISEPPS
jgi:tetratricopeptide (TPR) repeat protein